MSLLELLDRHISLDVPCEREYTVFDRASTDAYLDKHGFKFTNRVYPNMVESVSRDLDCGHETCNQWISHARNMLYRAVCAVVETMNRINDDDSIAHLVGFGTPFMVAAVHIKHRIFNTRDSIVDYVLACAFVVETLSIGIWRRFTVYPDTQHITVDLPRGQITAFYDAHDSSSRVWRVYPSTLDGGVVECLINLRHKNNQHATTSEVGALLECLCRL